jgi:hypothetical protein
MKTQHSGHNNCYMLYLVLMMHFASWSLFTSFSGEVGIGYWQCCRRRIQTNCDAMMMRQANKANNKRCPLLHIWRFGMNAVSGWRLLFRAMQITTWCFSRHEVPNYLSIYFSVRLCSNSFLFHIEYPVKTVVFLFIVPIATPYIPRC